MRLADLMKNGPVICDGAMGTYMSSVDKKFNGDFELANVEQPDLVERIHGDYIRAGAMVITTNTFAANRFTYGERTEELIKAGWEIAVRSAGERAAVLASIGQVNGENSVRTQEYLWIAEKFADLGAENYIFETQSRLDGIIEASRFIKERVPDAFIIASFSVNDSGFTTEGVFAEELLEDAFESGVVDAAGFNCGCSASHMLQVLKNIKLNDKALRFITVQPNAGYPMIVNRRTVYEGSPQIFASASAEMAEMGAVMLGGCCGTTPGHIKRLAEVLKGTESRIKKAPGGDKTEETGEISEDTGSRFWDKLVSGQKPVAVELDPPADADTAKFLRGVKDLKEADVDIITIADCPIGRARMDSSLLACKVYREYGVETLPHMTCRDRNLNATQALMLGLYAEGIRNMLLVTGDPVPSASRDEVKTVYQFNSRKLAAFASSLSGKMFPNEVHFFGALNVNARNFDVQIKLAKEKIENGMAGFLTQPVLTPQAFENLKRAKEELGALGGYILGGIIPVVSERNARFMNSEISGINVDDKITEMYVGKERDEAEVIAVEISSEIARRIAPYVDGYYYMTPFQRTGLIRRILENI